MKELLKGPLSVFKKSLLRNITCLSVICSSMYINIAIAMPSIELSGELKQGGLIVGKTASNNSVTLNNKPLTVSENGDYVFGFSRDDKASYNLVITEPNGAMAKKMSPTNARQADRRNAQHHICSLRIRSSNSSICRSHVLKRQLFLRDWKSHVQ